MYPVLVYGTLRPGSTNYPHFLEGFTSSEKTVTLDGFMMLADTDMVYPFIARGEGTITATLITIQDDVYEEIVSDLDFLEGVRFTGSKSVKNLYNRELHTFMHDGQETQAWIYIPGERILRDVLRYVNVWENGDWLTHPEAF